MEKIKMSRSDRAKQFAPFDALKGLQTALRMKEYANEKRQRGDLPEEKIEEISSKILSIDKNTEIEVSYFVDGYERKIKGKAKIDIPFQTLTFEKTVISFDDITDMVILTSPNHSK